VEVITDGQERKVIVDDAYILRSIQEPNADVVKGFNPGLMISYKEQVKEEDVAKIVEFIKELK
jgi:cytochrome c oxidase subunit II